MFRKRKMIKGVTMTEYVLLAGLIAGAAILALTSVGTSFASFFTSLGTSVESAGSNW